GELLVGLRALEKMTRRELDDAEVATLLARRLDVFGRFYMHTDADASNAMVAALRQDPRFDAAIDNAHEPLAWRRFIDAPPRELRGPLIDRFLEPNHVGCGHLRLQLTRAKEFGSREGLVQAVLRCLHQK